MLFLLLLSRSGTAHAYCQAYWPDAGGFVKWPSGSIVNVYLNVNMSMLCNGNGSAPCTSLTDVQRTVQGAIDEINDMSAVNVTLRYQGHYFGAAGVKITGAVHIYAFDIFNPTTAGSTGVYGANGVATSSTMAIDYPKTWSSFLSGSNVYPLHGVVVHELVHALGMDHPNECGQTVASAVNGGFAGQHLYQDDIIGLQTVYGNRPSTAARLTSGEDTNFSSWSSQPLPSQANESQGRFAPASFSLVGLVTFPRDYATRRVRTLSNNTYVGDFSAQSIYHTGTATSNFFDALTVYSSAYSLTTGTMNLSVRSTGDGGSNWGSAMAFTGDTTDAPGVSAAYDYTTQKYIVFWRDSDHQGPNDQNVKYVVWDPPPPYPLPPGTRLKWPGTQLLRSADSVGVACGPSSVVGVENCLLAWTSTGWNRTLYWTPFRVSGTTIVIEEANVVASPYVVLGQPSITYTGNPTWPWVMSFNQGGTLAYTQRKGVTGDWTGLLTHSVGYSVSPTVGSRWPFCWFPPCPPREVDMYTRN